MADLFSAVLSIPAALSRSIGSIAPAPGALVIEDPPNDSKLRTRLSFQSYPDTIEEVYTLTQYREIAATRMSQPGFVAYRGGNWGAFPLELQFRAGLDVGKDAAGKSASTPVLDPIPSNPFKAYLPTRNSPDFDTPQMQQQLIDNEINVRWCQALAFPLARGLGATAQKQIIGSKVNAGAQASELSSTGAAIANLQRFDPPIILIQFGSWLTIRGYVTSVTIKWERPFHPRTGRAYGATVDFQFQPLMPFYPNFQSIANQSGDEAYVARTDRLRAAADVRAAQSNNAASNLEARVGGG
jgi:hypothetical protein